MKIARMYYTIREVCEIVGLSYSTVHREMKSGKLKASRRTGKNLVKKEWIEEWLNPKQEVK